jgi:transmembrane sensor
MIKNIWILIAKKLNGEATAEELRELDALLAESEDEVSMEALTQLWEKTSAPAKQATGELDEKWDRFNARLDIMEAGENEACGPEDPAASSTPLLKKIIKYTAYAAVVGLFAGIVYWKSVPGRTDQGITAVVAPANGVSKIILPDGSNVWLNSGSKISYRNNDENQCREVKLSGEAYFDVVKDAGHPFTVETAHFKIKVLGTAFNVRSYANDQNAEATLVRGHIELTLTKSPDKKYVLNPSERFKLNSLPAPAKSKNVKLGKSDSLDFSSIELSRVQEHTIEGLPSETLWMKSLINFDGTEFEEIASMMEHKYNVTFIFKDDEAKKLKFTGKFTNEAIEVAMRELRATANFHYKIEKDQITIY